MSRKKILLIEDDLTLNDAFSILLKKENYDVVSAYNGQEGLNKLEDFKPDLILLDLLMPVLDGKGFLKAFNNKQKIPIIVFSNLDAKDEIKEVMQLGATKYILKAWASPRELTRVIDSLI